MKLINTNNIRIPFETTASVSEPTASAAETTVSASETTILASETAVSAAETTVSTSETTVLASETTVSELPGYLLEVSSHQYRKVNVAHLGCVINYFYPC